MNRETADPTAGPLLSSLLTSRMLATAPVRVVEPDPWLAHTPFAMWLVEALSPDTIVELGTHSGNSFCAMAQAAHSLELPTSLVAVEPDGTVVGFVMGELYRGSTVSGKRGRRSTPSAWTQISRSRASARSSSRSSSTTWESWGQRRSSPWSTLRTGR